MRYVKYRELKGFASHGPILTLLTLLSLCAVCVGVYIMVTMSPNALLEMDLSASATVPELVMPGVPEGESPLIADENRKDNFYTCLIAGMDVDMTRTDTIVVVSLDLENGAISILNIPRDTRSYMESGKVHKINAAHNKGMGRMLEEIQNTVGFYPDNYVVLNYSVFERFIDAIGGVEVDVERDMHYVDPDQDLVIDLKAGLQTLDGENALKYMRFRKGNDGIGYDDADLGRIRAQQKLYKAVLEKLMTPATVAKIPRLINVVASDIETDIGFSQMLWLGIKAVSLDFENVTTYTLPGRAVGADFVADKDEVLTLVNEHFNPYIEDITELNIAK